MAQAAPKKNYTLATGRRKTSVARVRITEGTGLIQINERRSCVRRVPAMGWTSISLLALFAGTVAAVVLLVFGALTWFLNHPVD